MPKLLLKSITSLLILSIFLLVTLQFIISNVKLSRFPAYDFEVFYLAGQQVRSEQNPYLMVGKDIVRNPPPAVLLFMLLPLFPIQLSQIVWFVISFITFIIGSYFLFKTLAEFGKDKYFNILNWRLWLPYLSLSLIFFPFRYNLGSGQVNNFLFLLIVLAFYLLQQKEELWSGFSLALSIVLKITPIFLLYTLLIQKRLKIVLRTLIYLIIISIVTAGLIGPEVYRHYLAIPSSFFDFGVSVYYNQSFAGFLARAFNNFELTKWTVLLSVILASALLLIINKNLTKSRFLSNSILWNLSIIYMLIFAPFAWQHHFVIIIFPLVMTAYLGYKMKFSYKFFSLLVSSYLLIGWNIKNPATFADKGIVGVLILSHVFLGSILLLFLNYYLVKKSIKR